MTTEVDMAVRGGVDGFGRRLVNRGDIVAIVDRNGAPPERGAKRLTTANGDDRAGQQASVAEALVDVCPDRVGWFRFYYRDERWEWSPEVRRIHGCANGDAAVTTKLLMSHIHPEDRPRVASVIDDIRRTPRAFVTRYRIVDIGGAVHDVGAVGSRLWENGSGIIGTHGFCIDVTVSEHDRNELLTEALAELAESRAVIEQAKGMLMKIYRMDADRAFEILRWRSRQTNIKLRLFANQVCQELRALEPGACAADAADHILMTAHRRVKTDLGGQEHASPNRALNTIR